jgi:L-lactate dehydrogenase complex protein LldG
MSSRENILAAIKNSQPAFRELPALPVPGPSSSHAPDPSPLSHFIKVLEAIGGSAYIVSSFDRIATILKEHHPDIRRIVSNCPELSRRDSSKPEFAEMITGSEDPHTLENIDLAILPAHFGVAENGACWVTEDQMIERVLPFICQHLVLVIDKKSIAATMHEAYDRIAQVELSGASYGFATFIAGPSKTADIEQSLVLGAHGPKSLTVFLLDGEMSDAGYY